MTSLSTHVLDSANGGPKCPVRVSVSDENGNLVAWEVTDSDGRIGSLGGELEPGKYEITWQLQGAFLVRLTATIDASEDRHYHVPLLASDVSAVAYLGV